MPVRRGPHGRFVAATTSPRPAAQELPVIADVPRVVPPVQAHAARILALRNKEGDEAALREAWENTEQARNKFTAAMDKLVGVGTVIVCESCGTPAWSSNAGYVNGKGATCEQCLEDFYSHCDECGEYVLSDDAHWLNDQSYCTVCRDRYFRMCAGCNEFARNDDMHEVQGADFCEPCWDDLPYCEDHDVVYREGGYCERCGDGTEVAERPDGLRHNDPRCPCTAPVPDFLFPYVGGAIRSDRMVTMSMPAGVMDENGSYRILSVLTNAIYSRKDGLADQPQWPGARAPYMCDKAGMETVQRLWPTFDKTWLTKDGTLPKRISKMLYKECRKFKASAELLAQIGTIATEYTPKGGDVYIHLTRDLGEGRNAYGNSTSCWWSDYTQSRCTFKGIGGLVIRTYASETRTPENLTGRAFILPIDKDYKPTHDTVLAAGYVIFNCYGSELSEYRAPRLVSMMTGLDYKRIGFSPPDDYMANGCKGGYGYGELGINADFGYLVAAQATLDAAPDIIYPLGQCFPETTTHGIVVNRTAAAPAA